MWNVAIRPLYAEQSLFCHNIKVEMDKEENVESSNCVKNKTYGQRQSVAAFSAERLPYRNVHHNEIFFFW